MSESGHRSADHFYASAIALEYVLVDILAWIYLTAADPIQTAADHRKSLKVGLARVKRPSGPEGELVMRMLADSVDAIAEQAGRSADRMLRDRG